MKFGRRANWAVPIAMTAIGSSVQAASANPIVKVALHPSELPHRSAAASERSAAAADQSPRKSTKATAAAVNRRCYFLKFK